MGILAVRAGLPQLAALCFLGLGASLLGVGCDTKSNKSKVSSSLFLAPIRAQGSGGDNGIIQHSDRLDTVVAIQPNKLPGELENVPTEPFVLGRLSARDPRTGDIDLTDNLLFFEAQSRSVLSQNLCPDPSDAECGRVRLNYNARGLDFVQNEDSILSTTVTPILLKSGWVMTFDTGTKNLIAFREEPNRTYLDAEGIPKVIRYRSAESPTGEVDLSSENFGAGNGVVLSVVISGEDMADQLPNVQAEPIVSSIFEVEENKVLIIFATGTIRAVHLLELSEEEVDTTFDLDDPANEDKIFKVRFLRGNFKLFEPGPGDVLPQPFLSFNTISERITGETDILLEAFQPVLIPDANPEALMYDTISSIFMRVGLARLGGEIVGATLGVASPRSTLINALQDGGTGDLVSPPFRPSGGFYNPDKKKTEIIFTEEVTNNVLAYDYTAPLDRNIRIFVSASNLSQRRTPGGGVANVPPAEPFLGFARGDVTANRLVFDQGLDQLLSVSYTSGVVVIVADNQAIGEATSSQLAELTYIEPLDENNIRAFDVVSNSLVEIRLDYAAFPVRFK